MYVSTKSVFAVSKYQSASTIPPSLAYTVATPAVSVITTSGNGASRDEHKAIATGLGICWGKDKKGELIGGWAAEYVEYFDTYVDDDIAKSHAEMWLTKSLNHELNIRGVQKHSEFQMFHNFVNIEQNFGYCLTALGFLNFEFAAPATV